MPELFFGLYALIDAGIASGAIGAGVTGLSAAESLSHALNSGPSAPAAAPAPPLNYLDPTQVQGILSGVGSNLPGIQAMTGGALSPNAAGAESANQAGDAGQTGLIQQAVNQWLGGNQNPQTPVTNTNPNATQEQQAPGAQEFNIHRILSGLNTTKPGLTFQPPF